MKTTDLRIPLGRVALAGELDLPASADGLVLFAHGSGSSRRSPRNQYVATVLRQAGMGTLLFDLLTPEEEAEEAHTRHLRFDIPLLADRLARATRWVLDEVTTAGSSRSQIGYNGLEELKELEELNKLNRNSARPARNLTDGRTKDITVGYFGSSTGAAAALVAAAGLGEVISAVVSRGGRPDLAGDALERVTAPTLLIVGGTDEPVIPLNEQAYDQLRCERALRIIPGASHLFEEPGALEIVANMAAEWFASRLRPAAPRGRKS